MSGPGGATGSKAVTIPPMTQIQEMVVITPQQEGEGDFTVKVPVEREEIFPENNEKKFHMAIRKETLKVLVVDSQPRWEFRYLRNALMRDPGVAGETRCCSIRRSAWARARAISDRSRTSARICRATMWFSSAMSA